MKLMQSICCFFSSRCANEAPEAKKADRDASAGELVGPLGKNPLVPQLVKPKIPARARSRISASPLLARCRH
jgi:hypothetical protein